MYLFFVFSIILLLNLNTINPTNILIIIVIGINIRFVTNDILSLVLLCIYIPKNVVNNVIAIVSSALAPTNNICGIALSWPIFLSIRDTIDGISTAGDTAAIINPSIEPWINVNPKNLIDKKAIVNPSNVAGTILKSIAGLPICFIWDKLIPSPPINNTVTKARRKKIKRSRKRIKKKS